MRMRRWLPLLLLTALSAVPAGATGGQVLRSGDHFVQDGHVFVPKGVNFELHGHPWSLWPNYSANTSEVEAELDRARRLGANVIRVFVTSDNFGGVPANYDIGAKDATGHIWDTSLSQLDDFLGRADGHGLKVLLTLYDGLNGFRNVNGVCRGQIGNPYARGEAWDWQNTSPDSNGNTWYHGPDIRPFRNHADEILNRTIPNTTRTLANDPRIFGWDVMNEPDHLFNQPACGFYSKDYVNAWIGWMARHVRLYTQAPITAGTYGWFLNPNDKERGTISFTSSSMDYTTQGTARSLWDDLDFISIHWYQPADRFASAISATKNYLASRIPGGKPVMIEEIGQADEGWYQVGSTCYHQTMPGCGVGDVTCNRNWIHNWTASWTATAKAYGVGALIWTGSDFVRTANCANGAELNQDFFGFYDGNGVIKPAGQAFAPAGVNTSCARAAFRTWDGLHWLTAQNGGGPGSYLDASGSGTVPGANSIFTFVRSGDAIGLAINKGGTWYYVSANQGGASYITVDRTQFLQWESFGLVYLGFVSGLGDDAVAFRTWGYNGTPYYFSASNAGGGPVNADRTWVLPWETFRMVCQ
jgi:hypothetical protein